MLTPKGVKPSNINILGSCYGIPFSIPVLAEVIDFVFSDRFVFRLFPRDIALAVTMFLFLVFCVSFIAFSVGEISHAPVPASPPRDRVFVLVCLFFSSLCLVSCSDAVLTV